MSLQCIVKFTICTCFLIQGCQSDRNKTFGRNKTVPTEYLNRICCCDGDFIVTLDKGDIDRSRPRFILWYNGMKIDDVLEGTAYKDIGDYIFVLTVVRDEEGSEIMRWLHSDKGISVSRRLRAHLISKKNGRVSSAEPVETEYIGICKKGSKWGEDAFSFHDGKVTINSRRLARQVVFYFKLRE